MNAEQLVSAEYSVCMRYRVFHTAANVKRHQSTDVYARKWMHYVRVHSAPGPLSVATWMGFQARSIVIRFLRLPYSIGGTLDRSLHSLNWTVRVEFTDESNDKYRLRRRTLSKTGSGSLTAVMPCFLGRLDGAIRRVYE